MRRNLFVFIFLILLSVLFLWGYNETFFQQDEWGGFGTVISLSGQTIPQWITGMVGVHFVPFANLIWLILYKIFGFNALFYILFATFLHAFSSFLVYLLANKITKSFFIGVVTSILFLTSGRTAQAFTHLSIFPSTITSFIFIMLFLIILSYKKTNEFSFKEIILLILIFLTSVFFREDGLLLIPVFPIFLFFFKRKTLNYNNLKYFATFYAVSIGYLIFRIVRQFFDASIVSVSSTNYWSSYIYNGLSLPFKLFVQNLIDIETPYLWVWFHRKVLYHIDFPQTVMDTLGVDLIILTGVVFFGFMFIVSSRFVSLKKYKNVLWFSVLFTALCGFLLATIGRQIGMVESRYLYLSSFAVLLFLSIFLYLAWKNKEYGIPLKVLVIIILFFYFWSSYGKIHNIISLRKDESHARKNIFYELQREVPILPKYAVFYVTCKKTCTRNVHFGLPNEIVLPFSSGPGWIFLMPYAQKNPIYSKFFIQEENGKYFLWDMGSQGYKELEGYGYGYFTDYATLSRALKNKSYVRIIHLLYDDKNFKLKRI